MHGITKDVALLTPDVLFIKAEGVVEQFFP
jgi:hypothetical protein